MIYLFYYFIFLFFFFFFQAEDGIRDYKVTGVQTCALPIFSIGAFKDRSKALRSPSAPQPIQLERQQMVQQIVTRRDLREHVAYFSRSVRLARGALRTSALYRRAGSTHFETPKRPPAAAIKRGVKRRTRSTACCGTESNVRARPIRTERTK